MLSGYANPDVLVTTEWVAQHLEDPNVRVVESDEMGCLPTRTSWHIVASASARLTLGSY
jgi:3-mercaptopyruvate sulfurtransferase SseA